MAHKSDHETKKEVKMLPVVCMVYNRPRETQNLLNHIASGPFTDIWVVSDGPNPFRPGDEQLVQEVRSLVDSFSDSTYVHKVFWNQNKGLQRTFIDGLSLAFSEYPEILVLEDDCEPHLDSLDFYTNGLKELSQHGERGTVSGFTFLRKGVNCGHWKSARFSSWGWASSSELWLQFVDWLNVVGFDYPSRVNQKRLLRNSPPLYKFEYSQMLARHEKLNTWDVAFDLFLRLNNYLTLKPARPLIRNIGFSPTATHTKRGASTAGMEMERYEFGPYLSDIGDEDEAQSKLGFYVRSKLTGLGSRRWSTG